MGPATMACSRSPRTVLLTATSLAAAVILWGLDVRVSSVAPAHEERLPGTSPRPGAENIMFVETSCAWDGRASSGRLSRRHACAVESAARGNPTAAVYYLHTCVSPPADDVVTQQLRSYDNVHLVPANVTLLLQGTPLAGEFLWEQLAHSQHRLEHTSDVLRYVTLWKYGGTYLDLDVVVLRSLTGMSNFAGAESPTDVAAGVLNFAHDGAGHEVAEACLEDLRTQFRGYDWGYNGPGVITRVLKRTCGVRQVRHMSPERCRGFTVHPPSAFYPIPWRQWRLYFDEAASNRTLPRLRDSLAIHVWNKFSVAENISVGSRQPYGVIASRHCPRVYASCGKVF